MDKKSSLFSRSPFIVLAIVLVMEIALVFLFVPKGTLIRVQQQELQSVTSNLGEQASEYVQQQSDHYYYSSFVETGILQTSYDFLIGQWNEDDTFDDRGFGKLVEDRLDATWLALNLAFRRITTLLLWAPYVLPFLIAVIVDGLVEREIRKSRFVFASPATHRTAKIAFALVVGALISIPFLPFSVTPLLPAYFVWAFAMAAWAFTANMQKRL